eukprot:gene6172-4450_t
MWVLSPHLLEKKAWEWNGRHEILLSLSSGFACKKTQRNSHYLKSDVVSCCYCQTEPRVAIHVMVATQQAEEIKRFFLQFCEPPLRVTGDESGAAGRVLWTQEVDVMKLLMECPTVSAQLFDCPISLLEHLRCESAALSHTADHSITPSQLSIRLTHFPPVQAVTPTLAPSQGVLVQVCGTVVRMSTKRVAPFLIKRMCPRCRQVAECYTTPFDRSSSSKMYCESASCRREELQVVDQVWMDYAECRLQQRSGLCGELPRSILVTLDDELSVKCTVGQFVEVIGVFFHKWRQVYPGSRPVIEPTLWATNVLPMEAYRGAANATLSVDQETPDSLSDGRPPCPLAFTPENYFLSFKKMKLNRTVSLVGSSCPQLSGLFAPRLAMLLATLGGTVTSASPSIRIRSTIHCLLSQLLRFAGLISPRSTCTTGMGSTSAGLTVAATKEHGEWVLEPGALVLSDGGVCIIDELRTVAVADRAALHEAMEQQTISVAKGGLVTKLRTNCAVIAACNPPHQKGKGGAVSTSVGVGGPLLSRFDLVFLLWDTPQPDLDDKIADHILACCSGGLDGGDGRARTGCPMLSVDEMTRYLWWVRGQYVHVEGPKLSDHAADLLGRYFDLLRSRGASPALDDAIPVTIRMLESLVRLTQAFAKLHLQAVCTVDDAAMAIFLMERSAHGLKCVLWDGLYSSSKCLDDVFLSDDEASVQQQEEVLRTLVRVIYQYNVDSSESKAPGDPALRATEEAPHPDILTARRRELSAVSPALARHSGPATQRTASDSQGTRNAPLELEEVSAGLTPRTVSQYSLPPEDARRDALLSKEDFLAIQRARGGGTPLDTDNLSPYSTPRRQNGNRDSKDSLSPLPSDSSQGQIRRDGAPAVEPTGPSSQPQKRRRSATELMDSLRQQWASYPHLKVIHLGTFYPLGTNIRCGCTRIENIDTATGRRWYVHQNFFFHSLFFSFLFFFFSFLLCFISSFFLFEFLLVLLAYFHLYC